jgi:NADH-quinone oxidoreductase subunit L
MHALHELFPNDDFTLLAIIVLLPLLGALVNGLFGKRLGREAVTLMGCGTIFVSFLFSVVTFMALSQHGEDGEGVKLVWKGWQWMSLSLQRDSGATSLWVSLSADALSGTMALIVTGIGFLIHLYSTKYMEEDPGYYRFFTYLNLFIFSMLVLILGDSLPVLFVGWEGVGLCSYLLIGFWFGDDKNATAGKKAFITNRIGDFGLLVAMGLLLYYCGALDWSGIEGARQNLLTEVTIWPLGDHVPLANLLPAGAAEWLNKPRTASAATLVGLFLFLGCAGKSAQLPLYVWLPDAMAGPTPVSALIHAATMVTAGVYLVCRTASIFVLSPAAMFVVAFVGGLTAVWAAIIAFAQNDIKKVLAYSTVSQLGYMFLGVGVGAFSAGFFHVLTHAFFKACMFLGAGSVIHAMHARIHDTDASQDMRNMGGLKKYLPYTFATFALSWAAIIGIPGTSGFFSKDEILLKAYTSYIAVPPGIKDSFEWPKWGGTVLYAFGICGAIMTAFYMTRLFVGTFFGEFKGWTIVKKWKEPEHAHGHHGDEPLQGPTPHESPWQMWVPLAVLAFGAVFTGLLSAHALSVVGLHLAPLDHFLEPVFKTAAGSVKAVEGAEGMMGQFLAAALAAVGVGAGGAYYVYVQMKGEPARSFAEAFPRLHQFVYDKLRVDEFYEETVIGAVDSLAEFGAWADKWLVDGILAKLSAFVVRSTGSALRLIQTGRIQAYAAVMVVGLGLVGWFLIAPHASAKVIANHAAGAYSVTAAPGLGYSYRWDEDGDGKWDSDEFGDKKEVSFDLDVDKGRTVALEVKNAFGQRAVKTFELKRPKPDRSGLGPSTTIDVTQGADGKLKGTPRAPGGAAVGRPGAQPGRPPGQPGGQPGMRQAPPIMPGQQLPPGHPPMPTQGGQ